jgi:hypothetical protein
MGTDDVDVMLPPTGVTSETENSLDRLFSELDGQLTDGPPARILGIHDDGREWWIQVARGDDVTNTIVLRVSRFARVIHAGAALTQWSSSEASLPRVVRAMCLV